MRKLAAILLTLTLILGLSGLAQASPMGMFSTDRFGYTGTITKYNTLADAQAGTNQVSQTPVGNRDLSLYMVNQYAPAGSNYNIAMGSWWYTTDPQGRAGYGNTTGNSGLGFVQLYDSDGSTDTGFNVEFGNWDGTYWTEFSASLSGANADAADYARLWANDPWSGDDGGVFIEYNLVFIAYGLQGQETSPGVIEANNHPTGVSGSFSGIFQNTGSAAPGFYKFEFDLDMDNWAFEQSEAGNLTGEYPELDPSRFVAVDSSATPEPGTMLLLGSAAGALGWFRRRRKAQK